MKVERAPRKTQINNQFSCFMTYFSHKFQFRDLPRMNQDYKNVK